MAVTEQDVQQAEKRMAALRENGFAVSARYDRRTARIVVNLNTGVQIACPTRLMEGLADASPDDLAEIEISPAGLALHWPKLDANVYVPALLQGVFGSKRWMAAQLGAVGGKARSRAKAAAARENGRKGGRPRWRPLMRVLLSGACRQAHGAQVGGLCLGATGPPDGREAWGDAVGDICYGAGAARRRSASRRRPAGGVMEEKKWHWKTSW
jgi:Protein of unknown function (DUF2442)